MTCDAMNLQRSNSLAVVEVETALQPVSLRFGPRDRTGESYYHKSQNLTISTYSECKYYNVQEKL